MKPTNPPICVSVSTRWLAEQSLPSEKQYVFAYHITIHNKGDFAAKLLTRHWVIIDANQERQEIHGSGVIGQQPLIQPGTSYEYTSGVILKTPIGTMQGSYNMIDNNGCTLDVKIEPFLLSIPNAVH